MNGLMQLSVCCLLLFAGCQSTNRLTGQVSRDSSAQGTQASTQSRGGLPPASQRQEQSPRTGGFPDTVAEHVKIGQGEVAAWYSDQQPHHLSTARMHFDEAVRQRPRDAAAHHGLAIVADLEKKFAEAERHYQLALEQNPQDSKLLGDLGYSYLLQNRLIESERTLLRAIQADSSNQNAIKHLGDTYARQGKAELAEENYRKVLSPEQVQRALATNQPRANPEDRSSPNGSLVDRLMPNQRDKADPMSDIMQKMEQERLAAEMRRQQGASGGTPPAPFATATPGSFPAGRQSPEERLKHELAAIDREPYQNRANGPIVIESQQGRTPSHPESVHWSEQSGHVPPSQPHAWAADSMPRNSGATGNAYEFENAPGIPPGADRQVADAFPNSASPQLAPSNPDSDRLVQPWTGVEPTNSLGAVPSVNPALHHQPQINRQLPPSQPPSSVPPELGVATAAPAGANHLRQPNLGTPSSAANAPTSLEEASKMAARMGMGFGPGSMFPVFNNSPATNSAGTHSHWNGESFPAPHRALPTDLPPPDLSQAFQPEPARMSSPPSLPGQPMPPVNAPAHSQKQFGTASRYDAATLQGMHVPQSNVPQAFPQPMGQERQRADEQLNQTMNRAWGQGTSNALSAPGVEQAAVRQTPQVHGGVMREPADWAWQGGNSASPASSGVEQASGFRDGNSIVTPQAYRSSVEFPGATQPPQQFISDPSIRQPQNSSFVTPAPYQQQPHEPSPAPRATDHSWPTIIPGGR